MLSIVPIPAFNDNYLWLATDGENAIVVDPGDPTPVIDYLEENNLKLSAILVTHHHADHTGGVKTLKNKYPCKVYGPKNDPVSDLDIEFCGGESFTIKELSLNFSVLAVPGHTLGHIAYFAPMENQASESPLLFCGDTLFSAGCGRMFEGTAEQMWASMLKLRELPENTLIFPAHEYTLSNLAFALEVESDNLDLQSHLEHVLSLREKNTPSLPSRIGIEKRINPFLRADVQSVKKAAESYATQSLTSSTQVFARIRQWKDRF